ncbi:hypothetical protein KCTC52924_03054 [Arenibacter antarcticus]|uniref:FG-GAP repeat domain-containing protein n=1 Tax=Arenibacter antarcticus TaxID=2040469 RepID=A0ABW5VJP6_9FLAO|nr:VCBS repeat-containing protein [Arenibacter sp. H213]MCM4166134.1 VCBS repeat-containing protein [Arenibacter sp. H213]
MKKFVLLSVLLVLFYACSERKKGGEEVDIVKIPISNLQGNQLARIHCSNCHLFVPPDSLPKFSWKNDVLPAMAHRLGIYNGDHQPDSLFDRGSGGDIVRKANIFPEQPLLARADWDKIVDYYIDNAPDSMPAIARTKKINMGLRHFNYKEVAYSHRPPLTTMVKIRPEGKGVVYADGKQNINSLTFLTPDLEKDYVVGLKTSPVHYYEKKDTIYLTTAGKSIFPHDAAEGTLLKISRSGPQQRFNNSKMGIENMQRPVYMAYGDLNGNGREDIVACEYGNHTGKLVYFINQGKNGYEKNLLNNRPGAITAIIKDMNGDGLNDIMALMAQGDEGIFFYENKGDGSFVEKRLLSFMPLFGSQYMELADFNNDGLDDIIYVCGDNADKTPYLKNYHGIYIFLNEGDLKFKQAYFYPLNGAYKAMARDFDLDGDLDIAAISFFPDYIHHPEESFVYLENKGQMDFVDYSFPQSTNGRWIVMDAEDMDGDGDVDIALGSFVYFTPAGDTTGLGKKWLTTSPSVIILENTIR